MAVITQSLHWPGDYGGRINTSTPLGKLTIQDSNWIPNVLSSYQPP